MTRQEIYNQLVRAKRPHDIFGDITESELKNKFRNLAKQIHPDTASSSEQYISQQGFSLLQNIYTLAQKEMADGIYGVVSVTDLYKHQTPLFDLTIKGKTYIFYECICNGEVSDIYRGLCGNDVVCVKVGLDEADNDLIKTEYNTLMNYSHQSMPVVHEFLKINNCASIIMDNIEGENLVSIMENNKRINPQHVMWIMERLFSVVGYLHSNFIIHGNIIPENILINRDIHNVILTGFTFHIPEANQKDSHYQIVNDKFSAKEVSKTTLVQPQSDIYSLGKILIYLLGGNVVSNGMPVDVPQEIRNFARKMVSENVNTRPNDAWKLWDEWIQLRKRLYGERKFLKADF